MERGRASDCRPSAVVPRPLLFSNLRAPWGVILPAMPDEGSTQQSGDGSPDGLSSGDGAIGEALRLRPVFSDSSRPFVGVPTMSVQGVPLHGGAGTLVSREKPRRASWAHNPAVAGSTPAPATSLGKARAVGYTRAGTALKRTA